MITNYRFIKNTLAIVGFIVLAHFMYFFLSGSLIREKLYGTWIAVEICEEITITKKYLIRGNEVREYNIRGNQLILSTDERYKITLTKRYLQLNEIYYMKE